MKTVHIRPPASGRRDPSDVRKAAHALEHLEPRVHLAAYTSQSFADMFGLPGVIRDFTPPEGVIGFGAAAAGLGDIDGDGGADFAIAAPGRVAAGDQPPVAGRIFVYSGATGQLVRTLEDGFAEFGVSLANIGDINGDGRPDLLVGSPEFDGNRNALIDPTGAVYIFSGADGTALRTFTGPAAFAEYGRVVAALGDVSGDAAVEVLVGAPGAGPAGEGQVLVVTTAEVLPGVIGAENVYTLTGEAAGDRFGAAVISAGDVGPPGGEGDGAADILVGAPLNDGGGADSGRIYFFSGVDGALRYSVAGDRAADRFGTALGAGPAFAGPLLLIGAPGWDLDFNDGSAVTPDVGRVYSLDAATGGNRDAAGPRIGNAGTGFGSIITRVGDINGDGVPDHAFISPGRAESAARIQFYDGTGGSEIAAGFSLPADRRDLAFAAGDIDGDGVQDLLVSGLTGPGGVALVSAHLVLTPSSIHGGNDNLTFLFASSIGNRVGALADYAFINGEFVYQSQIPGVGLGATILGVNNAGVIVGRLFGPGEFGTVEATVPFIVQNGVRTLLHEAVVEVVGAEPPPANTLSPVKIGNDGTILLHQVDFVGTPQRAWSFKNGVLTLLWEGTVADVNDNGVIVGTRRDAGTNVHTGVVRGTDGVVTVLEGVRFAGAISNAGVVAGSDASNRLVTWNAGQITVIPLPPPFLQPQPQFSVSWQVHDINDEGEILATYFQTVGRGTSRTPFLFTPEDGLEELQRVLFGTASGALGGPLAFAEEGKILTTQGVLEPISEAVAWSIAPGSFLSSASNATHTAVVGRNPLGDTIVLVRAAGSDAWTGRQFSAFAGETTDAIAYTDPRSGVMYLFVLGENGVAWGNLGPDGLWGGTLFNDPAATVITDHATVMFASDGRAVLAGTDAQGDVVMWFQAPGVANPSIWIFSNITESHIEARGQEFVPVASDLTGFATTWGTDHLAYLDERGQVQVLWWAPGEALWRTDQLTSVEASGALSGNPTSFVTPWSTLHINAFDEEGNTVAVWWADGFGARWRTDALAPPTAAKLDPLSAAAFATPWNALNIFGLDADTGELTIYWWAPETGEWRVERIEAAGAPENLALTEPVAAAVSPAGVQNIFARQAGGGIARFFWDAQAGWRFESPTEAVAG